MTKRVSIVIPNFNGEKFLEKNLGYVIRAKSNPKNEILEIVVVDDKSTDDSVSVLKRISDVRLIKHTVNRGFGAAVNTGVRSARGELVCLLNTDVLPETDFLQYALKHFGQGEVFAVSLHEKGYGFAKGYFRNGYVGFEGGEPAEEVHDSFWASGGSSIIRRDLWNKLGGFDEKLLSPAYWEDLDLSYRAQKRGYRVLWEPKGQVIHEHETSYRKMNQNYIGRIKERNQLLFIWKNITSRTLIRRHRDAVASRILKTPGYLIIFIMAAVKYLDVRKLRAKEMREAKISDEAIFSRFK